MPPVNGHLLRAARRQRGETVAEVAEDIGVAPGSLSNIEGRRAPAGEDLTKALAARYGIPLDDLLDMTSEPARVVPLATLADRISYNTAEAAVMIGVKVSTIRDAIRAGEIPAAFIGSQYVVLHEDLKAWVEMKKQQTDLKKTA